MKIELLLLGKTKEDYLAAGIKDYSRRLRRYVPVELKYLRTKTRNAQSGSEIKGHESRLLNDHLFPGSFRMALDSSGNQYSSEKLAELLTNLELRGEADELYYRGTSWSSPRTARGCRSCPLVVSTDLYP